MLASKAKILNVGATSMMWMPKLGFGYQILDLGVQIMDLRIQIQDLAA